MNDDFWIAPHVEQHLDFSRYGGRDRVRGSLGSGEAILYAANGWFEEGSTAPGAGKRKAGLITITNERVLVIRKPGLISKDPPPISVPFRTIAMAGEHRTVSDVVVLGAYENHRWRPCYLHLGVTAAQHESLAATFGFAIRNSAEAAGGPQNAPAGLR